MAQKIQVVATLSTYADIARYIGGEHVEVKFIVSGNENAHYIRPRPSYALWLSRADVFIETGLDLELWVPALQEKAGNPRILSGQPGYVAVAQGIRMLDVPAVVDRSQGDVHIYGNPHVHTSPLNAKIIAENIASGFINLRPELAEYFQQRLQAFKEEIDRRMFGDVLVRLLTGEVLTRLTIQHKLIPFLQDKKYRGRPLIDYLGGWMKAMLPLHHRKLVAYHKNWAYFRDVFQLEIIGYVEPRPGIPPSPRHVEKLIQQMRQQDVRVILAANYFSQKKVQEIARKVHGVAVVVPLGVGGTPEVQNYFQLIDYWVDQLTEGFQKAYSGE
ncbi:MAG: zinc ABC transporter substrate-binding protein [Calditrichaeota bacterium]|nr:zinc ABC transporter substrate-binding protein [Calditrichota bacterium]